MQGRQPLYGVLALFIHCSISSATYASNAEAAASTLHQWYNATSGLWDNIFWWESANSLTTLADLAAIEPNIANVTKSLYSNTLARAPQSNAVMNSGGSGFLNEYYDDEAWWALAWLQVYNVTGQPEYLQAAVDIFQDLTNGWGSPCGGLWWDKSHTQENAITNELFLRVAARLSNQIPANQSYYLDWALREWDFFQTSGLINVNNTINDGLDLETCQNNNHTVWSYNQGVILGGLVELNKASPNVSFITTAKTIATAAVETLSDSKGILHESCDPTCDLTAAQFKGVFMRNLQILQLTAPEYEYQTFITKNADSIWANDRNDTNNELGSAWSGPFQPANAATQSAALDALVAAAAISAGNQTQPSTGNGTTTSRQGQILQGGGSNIWTDIMAIVSLLTAFKFSWIL